VVLGQVADPGVEEETVVDSVQLVLELFGTEYEVVLGGGGGLSGVEEVYKLEVYEVVDDSVQDVDELW
jgi:hypothetical protein